LQAIDFASVGLRALAFITVLQAAGLVLFRAFEWLPEDAVSRAGRRMRGSALVGVALVLAHAVSTAGRMAGEWSGILDAHLEAVVWTGRQGRSAACCVAGLLLIAATGRRRRFPRLFAVLGAVLVLSSFGLTGHTTELPGSLPLRALLVLHVGIAAFWIGSVVALHSLAVTPDKERLARAAGRFSTVAVWLVPLLLPAGVAVAWGLVADVAQFRTSWGVLLLIKLLGFGALLVLAATNRLRSLPALHLDVPGAVTRFRRLLLAEYTVLCAVLAATATMTSLFSPHQ
jgi:putative copper resistance protein D